MEIIKASLISEEDLINESNGVPLIICSSSNRLLKKIKNAGLKLVMLNQSLSKELLKYEPEDRPNKVEDIAKNILSIRSPICVTNFEMLFDPRYKLDVIKLFCDLARYNKVIVKWPGQYLNGKLIYETTENIDYHEYNCNAYQIRIVQ